MRAEKGWPLSRIEHLRAFFTGYTRCELCNSRGHGSPECWLHKHHEYAGAFWALLEQNPELRAAYRSWPFRSYEQQLELEPFLRRAHEQVYGGHVAD